MFSSNASQVSSDANYIEDVFSTYLYTGNGATQTITNGIDLAGEGGLVWGKNRTFADDHYLCDSARGPDNGLYSNTTAAQASGGGTTFGPTGFSVTATNGYLNANTYPFVSWTFRKQPKFFDVVTYTGTGSATTIPHNLGSVPGCIMIKNTSAAGQNWRVWHTSLNTATDQALSLNLTSSQGGGSGSYWNFTTPTSSVFTVGTDDSVNGSGRTYIAYIFATNAGGFGPSGNENVVSCGSVVNTGNPQVTLGYEPQWVLFKSATSPTGWYIVDNMRGLAVGQDQSILQPNTSGAEVTNSNYININATGFTTNSSLIVGETLIYIAIRRGPMKVPTLGTTVYNAIVRNGTQANATVTGSGFPVDLAFTSLRPAGTHNPVLSDRLRGATKTLGSRGAQAEQDEPIALTSFASMDGVSLGADNTGFWNGFNSVIGASYVNWFFRRAASFFDVVCFTLPGATTATYSHNLTVAPELMIVKTRGTVGNWFIYHKDLGTSAVLYLNGDFPAGTGSDYWSTTPTATQFSLNNANLWGTSTASVAYLFASTPGVSKVGSYTGTGTTQAIACGFTTGARYVLIKRTDSTGDWYVWDSARGITAGNDPYLQINNTNAEVTNTDYIDTSAAGFEITSTAPAAINANGGSYIFLAVA